MIFGIGTDIIAISRMERSLESHPRFAERIFTPGEISYCESKANKAQSYAARFAAKEALMKAIGTGWDGSINWIDIEVVNNEQGNPAFITHGKTKAFLESIGMTRLHLSLTHEKEFAVAYAIIECDPQ